FEAFGRIRLLSATFKRYHIRIGLSRSFLNRFSNLRRSSSGTLASPDGFVRIPNLSTKVNGIFPCLYTFFLLFPAHPNIWNFS
ncbi:hypothetical protein, partial [Dysosmobacter sp. HCP28S3_G4]|uniref:hypothetical protein n=1 Tax=Dysosmobacter sp. HCP28S3_G4 TaxID=3438938 RepID=UPI003F8AD74C